MYSIPWSPAKFLTDIEKPASIVRIAKTTVLLQDNTLDIAVPENFPSNSSVLVYPHSNEILKHFNPQQVEAVGQIARIRNYSSEPIILKKNSHTFGIRAMKHVTKIDEHKPFVNLPKYVLPRIEPKQYLRKLTQMRRS